MTLASTGANLDSDLQNQSTDTPLSATTPLDCDILTVVRDAHAHAEGARGRSLPSSDPMTSHYKPLGNKDVACVLQAKGR